MVGPVGKIEGGFESVKNPRWEETIGVVAAARRMDGTDLLIFRVGPNIHEGGIG